MQEEGEKLGTFVKLKKGAAFIGKRAAEAWADYIAIGVSM